MLHYLLCFLFALVNAARGALVIGRDAVLRESYDFVIVGGGTSGLTVADRLTENPKSLLPCLIAKLNREILTCISNSDRPSNRIWPSR